jgi:hypothetical protein
MVFTADEIEKIVKELTLLKQSCTPDEINANMEYNSFREQNRIFYDMILSDEGINEPVFKEMMKMKRRLEAGEDQYSVDVSFGRFMANKYIDPVIKNKPKEN